MANPTVETPTAATKTTASGMTLADASLWLFVSKVSAIGLTVFSAVAAYSILYFSSKVDTMKAAELLSFQTESSVAISSADARAADANRVAKLAEARAAEAGEGTAKAQAEAAAATERAAIADQHAAEANRIAAEAGEGTAVAMAEAAGATERTRLLEVEAGKQRERAARAEKDLLELQERIKPRVISTEQRTRLIALLRDASPKGLVEIVCVLGDGEGVKFAEEINNALKSAGWPTTDVQQSVYVGGNPIGFGLVELNPLRG